MRTSVLDVAKYILVAADRPMSTMKLQKLTYYSKAWHVAWTGEQLFREPFQAWANGPVSYALFQQHRGKYSISADELTVGDTGNVTVEQVQTIRKVLDAYLPLSGRELSELTHDELPWREARNGLPTGAPSDKIIPMDSMRKFYTALKDDPGAHLVTDLRRTS